MQIKWYGHAAFRITSESGLSIITDPYTPENIGYDPITETADIVIVSSDDDDAHCRSDLIQGAPIVVNALQVSQLDGRSQTVKNIPISAVEAMEIENHPLHTPGQNGMYRFEVDGISIAHMGDVGNPLNEEQTMFFKDVDILLALAGDMFTIALDELKRVIDVAQPKIVIPMHFRTLTYVPRNLFWIESFLSHFDDEQVDFLFGHETTLTTDDIPESTRVLVMDYARGC